MDERELEARMRAGLERRAAGADVGAPVVDRVREEVGARRRTRWGVGAAAAAVLVVAGGIGVVTQQDSGGAGEPRPIMQETGRPDGAPEEGLRTEYWGAVAVDVPADWGYGGAPDESGTACFPEAAVGPHGERLEGGSGLGWVGRPVALTDVCALVPDAWEPSAPYVWLGTGLPFGKHAYDNGYVQETVILAGTSITVGSDDAGLRARILASARERWLCEPRVEGPQDGRVELTREGLGTPAPGTLCAYREVDGVFQVAYSTTVGAGATAETFEVLLAGNDLPPGAARCAPSEFVVLGASFEDPFGPTMLDHRAVFLTDCGGVDVGRGPLVRLTPDVVEPWAHNGIPAVVYGPTGGKGAMIDSFIGPQG
ncbi:MAG TPA: hypothetical protein VD859_00520 [Nocardioides sp.]|nr:hypothetical protein [Nocardioides sp.]